MDHYEAGKMWASSMLDEAELEKQAFDSLLDGEPVLERGSRGVLVAEGDSWFDYRPWSNRDILKWLRKRHGYEVREARPKYGHTLQKMAEEPDQLGRVFECLEELKLDNKEPRAILLSAGGNDIASKETLVTLLNYKQSGLPPLKDPEVDQFIFTRMRNHLLHWIGAVDTFCSQTFGHVTPIFVHGYSKPVPNGDAFGWDLIGAFPGPWMRPAFEAKGYWDTIPMEQALEETTPIIGDLIDRFNTMLKQVESEISHFHHVELRGILSNELPNGYTDDWANELHPKKKGFMALAFEMAKQIENVL